ncbi:hypothetical protein [Pseudomonas sp. MF4836]|uniref:hypothetical protein n=1 Tax=Pseudomonas sp. MF4836 TaxID=1960827 RepID=UPI00129057BE|nr:hypothetical protein [Pseudomonas sp. MF4836]
MRNPSLTQNPRLAKCYNSINKQPFTKMRTTLLQTLSRMETRENGALNKSLLLATFLIAFMFLTYLIQAAYFQKSLIPLPSDPVEAFHMLAFESLFQNLLFFVFYSMGVVLCGTIFFIVLHLESLFNLFSRTRKYENRCLRRYTKSGIDLNEPKVRLEISESFRENNSKDDALFIADKKAEREKNLRQIIEHQQKTEELDRDLRRLENLHRLQVKRLYDEHKASRNI